MAEEAVVAALTELMAGGPEAEVVAELVVRKADGPGAVVGAPSQPFPGRGLADA